jgi:hypothetical protein
MQANEAFVVSFVAQGSMVVMSYCVFWPMEDLWAGLKDPLVFKLWLVSALVSTVGFCSFSYLLINDYRSTDVHVVTGLAYSLFLMSAAMYMPLATHGMWLATMFALFLSAMASCVLFYCSILLYGWTWVTVLMGVLAFHCTMIDFVFWGFTWTYISDEYGEHNYH